MRTLTAVLTALWIALFLGWAAGNLVVRIVSFEGGPPGTTVYDRHMARSSTLWGVGALVAIASFVALVLWMRTALPARLGAFLTADAVVYVGLLFWGYSSYAKTAQHPAPQYPGYRATLDVEVRAPKTLLDGRDMAVFFAHIPMGSSRDRRLNDDVRDDGDFKIVPIEVEIYSLHDWSLVVERVNAQGATLPYTFRLNLPDRPEKAVPWSEWMAPIPIQNREWTVNDGIKVRYRWSLTPEGEYRAYRP